MPSIRKPKRCQKAGSAPMTVLKVIPVLNRHLLDYAASRALTGRLSVNTVWRSTTFREELREKYAPRIRQRPPGFRNCGTACSRGAPTPRITCISEGNRSCAVFEGFLTFSVSSSTQGSIRRCPHWKAGRVRIELHGHCGPFKGFSKYERVHAFSTTTPRGAGHWERYGVSFLKT